MIKEENVYYLPERFTKFGQVFTKVKEAGRTLIYARSDENGVVAYEVFKRAFKNIVAGSKASKAEKYQGYDRYERYPGNEEFGIRAKYCMTLDRAEYWMEKWNNENTNENE